jgi:hypothetical protein
MERKEIISVIKNLINSNGYFIYGKTNIPLPLINEFGDVKQYITQINGDNVYLVNTVDTFATENFKTQITKLSTVVLKQILIDMCKHHNLEKPTFSDFKINFEKLFTETKLNTDRKNTLKRMLFHLCNGGLKNYLNDNYNRLKENYTTWFNTTYLDVILFEIDEMTLLNKLVDVHPPLFYQECNLYNFNILFKENLVQYFDNFDTDFRGSIMKVYRFDNEIIIETYLRRDSETNFYNLKYHSTVFETLTDAYIYGKNPKYADAINALLKS